MKQKPSSAKKRPPVKKQAAVTARAAPPKTRPKPKAAAKTSKGSIVSYKVNPLVRAGFYHEIAATLRSARAKAYRAIDSLMVEAYWNVGRQIIEEEQLGTERADYGAYLLRNLADKSKSWADLVFARRTINGG